MRRSCATHRAYLAAGALSILLSACGTTASYSHLRVSGDPTIVRAIDNAISKVAVNCGGQTATVTVKAETRFEYDTRRDTTQVGRENHQIERRTDCGK